MIDMKYPFYVTTLWLVFVVFVAIWFTHKRNQVDLSEAYVTGDSIPTEQLSLDDSIRRFIKFINVSHPDIVYAQAVLESGNFTSYGFRTRNNLFGMKRATRRANMNNGEGIWSHYERWEYSVVDYALYQATYMTDSAGRVYDRETYLRKLQRSYAEDPRYTEKLDKLSKLWNEEE